VNNIISVLHNGLRIMTPLLLASIGGLFTELTGMLNIGLEGLMLTAAFFSFVAAGVSGSILVGVTVGVLSAVVLALLFALTCLKLRANIFITGIATNLLAAALTGMLASYIFGRSGIYRFAEFPTLVLTARPDWSGAPGQILLGHSLFVYLGWLAVLLSAFLLYRTPLGLRLRATGQDDRTVQTLGLRPSWYRLAALIGCGIACGLAGSYLSLSLGAFVPNITAGRGWIALVIVFLGNKRPVGLFVASLLFAVAESLSNFSQGFLTLPSQIILAFPYIISVLALILYSIWEYHRHYISRFKLPPR
jgi:simple sugar transport system permease protein